MPVGLFRPRIICPLFGAIAAMLHAAPSPASGAAAVDEQDGAVIRCTEFDPVELRARQQLNRVPSNLSQHGIDGSAFLERGCAPVL